MQKTLFNRQQIKQATVPKTYDSFDRFPFGQFKGKTIGWIADNYPLHLEWWQRTRGIRFAQSIIQRINNAKNLAR